MARKKTHPLEGVQLCTSEGEPGWPEIEGATEIRSGPGHSDYEVIDPDDPGFRVSYTLAAGMQAVGPWRPREQAIAYLPTFFDAWWDQPPAPPCELRFELEEDGYIICTSLTIEARRYEWTGGKPRKSRARTEVSLAGIRNIRIGELKRRATRLALVEVYLLDNANASIRRPTREEKEIVAQAPQAFSALTEKAHTPHRGKKLSDAHLREVATVYREALEAAKPAPTKAVVKHFLTARSNAGRWVAEARKRGFLGEAEARRAGEKTNPKRRERKEHDG